MKPADPARILFIRWKSIGDVVQTLPAWNTLRAAFPKAFMAYMTSAENEGLLNLFPGVDAVLAFERRALFLLERGRGKLSAGWRTIWRSSLGGGFDLVLDMQGYGETALLTFLTRARQRWGVVYKPARSYAYTAPVARNKRGHLADIYLEVLHRNGIKGQEPNRLRIPQPALQSARQRLAELGVGDPGRPLLCLQPLTTTPKKNWPLERYAQLARHAEQRGFGVFVSGGPKDREQLQQSPLSAWPIACGQDLSTSCGLVSLADIVVGGDTGLLHAAHAAGSRILMIMRSHTVDRSGPYQRPEWAVAEAQLADLPAGRVVRAFD
jgi:ADP-heptose:LPS heptosyltransferase